MARQASGIFAKPGVTPCDYAGWTKLQTGAAMLLGPG